MTYSAWLFVLEVLHVSVEYLNKLLHMLTGGFFFCKASTVESSFIANLCNFRHQNAK
jgi:hypothetical protein